MHKVHALPWFWVVPARAPGAQHAARTVLKASACYESTMYTTYIFMLCGIYFGWWNSRSKERFLLCYVQEAAGARRRR